MPANQLEDVAQMEWDAFAQALKTPTRATAGARSSAHAMCRYFGEEECAELRRLAQHSEALRARAPLLGNVVFLPGIMGSYLVTLEHGVKEDLVWLNFLNLVRGDLERLRLSPDGTREAKADYTVRTSIVDKRTYARLILKLRARWNVQPFAFDWRKDIDVSSHALAAFIREKFPGQPVHLVAHSMGGLVCRNFIRLHKDLWESMRNAGNVTQGGRLIMLGTPNYGSFAIPQALSGDARQVRWLSRIDLRHTLAGLLEIMHSFIGTYQMLPAPSRLPDTAQDLYRLDVWGSLPASEEHLKRAQNFHKGLEDSATVNPERMHYIAGCNRPTLSALEIVEPGRFNYVLTHKGDGRVPHGLGILKDVPTYYVEEDHGSLPKNERVIAAVDQLLEHGRTAILPERPIAARVALPEGALWHRPVGEYLLGAELESIARQAEQADPDELRFAEDTILRAAVGEHRPARKPPQTQRVRSAPKRRLRLEVQRGDVTHVQAPVIVVGHYKGVTPINAIGALDKALNGWIRAAVERSMLGGHLGQVFFIPVRQHEIAAETILIAGMGEEGRFTRYDLRNLMMNVTYAIASLKMPQFATVLIGAGPGNLTIEQALRSLLFGICDALERLEEPQPIQSIIVVERDPQRYEDIYRISQEIKTEDSGGSFDIEVDKEALLTSDQETRAQEGGRPEEPQEKFGPRITIERDGDVFRFSAMTKNAVISVRQVDI